MSDFEEEDISDWEEEEDENDDGVNDDMNEDDMSEDDMSEDDMSEDDMNDDDMNDDDMNGENMNDDDMNDDDMNEENMNDDDMNEENMNDDAMNDDNMNDDIEYSEDILNYPIGIMDEILEQEMQTVQKRINAPRTMTHPQTVGIKNIQNSCAINACLQVMNILPLLQEEIKKPNSLDEISVINAFTILFKALKNSYKSIDPMKLFEDYRNENNLAANFVNEISQIISSNQHSVITLILEILYKQNLQCIQVTAKGITNPVFLQCNRMDFSKTFQGVRVQTLQKYLFISMTPPGADDFGRYNTPFVYPLQFCLRQNDMQYLLLLKAVIVNRPNHFVAYLRKFFSNDFILTDDDKKIRKVSYDSQNKDAYFASVACYIVIDIN